MELSTSLKELEQRVSRDEDDNVCGHKKRGNKICFLISGVILHGTI